MIEVEHLWKKGKMKRPYSYDKLQQVTHNKGIFYFIFLSYLGGGQIWVNEWVDDWHPGNITKSIKKSPCGDPLIFLACNHVYLLPQNREKG
jgi:hypothetical protein